jgi:shikimate kinase/3-dehydroquinate synthase
MAQRRDATRDEARPAAAPPPESGRRHVILVGFMAAGKSTVGRVLAERLGRPFLDMDTLCEARSGLSVPDLFACHGAPAFRRLERAVARSLAAEPPAVVAAGGGAFSFAGTRRLLLACGRCVWLDAPLALCLERILVEPERWPLACSGGREGLERLYRRRRPDYALAHLRVDAADENTEAIAEAVARVLGLDPGPSWLERLSRTEALRVCFPERAPLTELCLGRGSLARLGAHMAPRLGPGPVLLVTDEVIAPLALGQATASLEDAGFSVRHEILPPGRKDLQALARLWRAGLGAGADRSLVLVGLGGGTVLDLAGLAAATLLRGLRHVLVPTTLLAQADACLGGKTAIDLTEGRNLVGAVHQPRLVLVDTELIATLPEPEYVAGLAEVAKTGLAVEAELWRLLAARLGAVRAREPALVEALVRASLTAKARVVAADPGDRGRRRQLNLGHTLAHALEAATGGALRHGEAVAIGLCAAAALAEELGLAAPGLASSVRQLVGGLGLPTTVPAGVDPGEIEQRLAMDKKRQQGRPALVLPVWPGRAVVRAAGPAELAALVRLASGGRGATVGVHQPGEG